MAIPLSLATRWGDVEAAGYSIGYEDAADAAKVEACVAWFREHLEEGLRGGQKARQDDDNTDNGDSEADDKCAGCKLGPASSCNAECGRGADDDGQPDEAQEWHDYDRDC